MSPRERRLAEAEEDRAYRAEITRRMTFERLISCHGYDRAKDIMQGRDPASNADQAAWRNLGLRAAEKASAR